MHETSRITTQCKLIPVTQIIPCHSAGKIGKKKIEIFLICYTVTKPYSKVISLSLLNFKYSNYKFYARYTQNIKRENIKHLWMVKWKSDDGRDEISYTNIFMLEWRNVCASYFEWFDYAFDFMSCGAWFSFFVLQSWVLFLFGLLCGYIRSAQLDTLSDAIRRYFLAFCSTVRRSASINNVEVGRKTTEEGNQCNFSPRIQFL